MRTAKTTGEDDNDLVGENDGYDGDEGEADETGVVGSNMTRMMVKMMH